MYQNKYLKYKSKYLNSKNQLGGTRHHQILLDGISSAGKTTIAKYFVKHGYQHINSDDTNQQLLHLRVSELIDTNKYYTNNEMFIIGTRERTKMMYENGINEDTVYDDISQDILQHYLNKNDLFVIVIYASLGTLIRNILARRKDNPRGRNVFNQFTKKFVVGEPLRTSGLSLQQKLPNVANNNNGIDIVNRKEFRLQLKGNLKYIFESEQDLDEFVDQMFEKMDIFDDVDYTIKLRDGIKCDYLLVVGDKTPDEIFEELKQFIE